QAAVELRAGLGGNDVRLRAGGQDGRRDGVPDERVLARVAGELGEERRVVEGTVEVRQTAAERLALERGQGGEILLHGPDELDRRLDPAQLVQRADQSGDRGLRRRRRAVTGVATCRQLHPARGLLADRHLDDLPSAAADV